MRSSLSRAIQSSFSSRPRPGRRHLLSFFYRPAGQALLFFTVVTGLMLYPMFLDFSGKLVAAGDAYEYVWKLWWFKHTLLDTGQSPWIAPHIYYPHGYLLAYGESTAANTVLALPLTVFLGEIPTYNLLIFFSTLMSGFTMFLLAREITGSFGAGLLAGVIYAFAPFRRLQMLHLNIFTTQWLPLLFYFLERFARALKPKYGWAAGLSFALTALSSGYYAVAGALFVGVWGLVRFRPLKDYLKRKQTWTALGLFTATAVALVLPFTLPYMAVVGSSEAAIPMQNSNYYAASPLDYVIPSPFHFLWGPWISRNLLLRKPDPGEFILGLGFVALLFGFYGLRQAPGKVTRPWLAVTATAAVLSLGLTLHLTGRQTVIPAPPWLVEAVNGAFETISLHYALKPEPFTIGQDSGLVAPLPALFIRWFVPVLGSLRTWTRFGVIVLFGLAILAAAGAATWHRREIAPRRRGGLARSSLRKQRLAWGVVIGLALFELWWSPPAMITPEVERPVDRWLANQPDRFAIMEYPLSSAFRAEQLLYTRAHGKPIVHGYATYFSFVFSRRHPELIAFPNRAALERLAEWNVRYVLVETAAPYAAEAEPLLTEMRREGCLHQRATQGSVYVFELVNCAR